MNDKNCSECNGIFTPSHHSIRQCSARCKKLKKYRWHKIWMNKNNPPQSKLCGQCGEKFLSRSKIKKMCSPKCSRLRNLEQNKLWVLKYLRKPKEKTSCGICRKEFTKVYPTQKTCSKICRKKYKKERVKVAFMKYYHKKRKENPQYFYNLVKKWKTKENKTLPTCSICEKLHSLNRISRIYKTCSEKCAIKLRKQTDYLVHKRYYENKKNIILSISNLKYNKYVRT